MPVLPTGGKEKTTPQTNANPGTTETPNTGGTRPAGGARSGGKGASQEKTRLFKEALETTPKEQLLENRGSKSETLTFIQALGFSSRTSTYTDRSQVVTKCPDVVGAIFTSTEPIKVPRVPIEADVKTGFTAEQIEWEDVPADTPFDISMMDAMVLLTLPQYSSQFMYEGQLRGKFSAKFNSLDKKEAKLPTPHFLITGFQLKADQKVIDQKVGDEWQVIEGYERYAPLLTKTKASRSRSNSPSQEFSASDQTSIAIQQLLFGGKK